MSTVTSVTKHFPTANEGYTTTTISSTSSGSATVGLNSMVGLVDGTVFVGIIEPGLPNQQVFTGTVNLAGNNITGVVWTRGTNVTHPSGVVVVDYVSGTYINMMTKGIQVSHNQDGTFKDGVVTTTKIVDANVTSVKIADQSITPNKLATGAQKAYVATNEATTSSSYADLLTTTDSVTVTIGANGAALVSCYCYSNINTNNSISYLSFAISGATTIAAGTPANGTVDFLMQQPSGQNGNNYTHGGTILVTGLNPGSTVFKLKYKTSGGGGAAAFVNRYLSVLPV